MDCETLAEALTEVTRMPLGCCANFMLGHRNGECVDVEIENADFDVLYPKRRNHRAYESFPEFQTADTSGERIRQNISLADSFVRLGRADKLLRRMGNYISADDIKEVLRDHVEFPNSICRHDNPKVLEGLRMGTVFSMIVNLTAGISISAKGSPCETEYEHYHI